MRLNSAFRLVAVSSSLKEAISWLNAGMNVKRHVSLPFRNIPSHLHVSNEAIDEDFCLLQPGDIVAVCGATGTVGTAVVRRLAAQSTYKVRAVCRNRARALELFENIHENLEIVEADIKDEISISEALDGVSAIICCIGTTAFPSKKWKNGNTPYEVNYKALQHIITSWISAKNITKKKKFVHLSSIGVERRKRPPFNILNAFGVLDSLQLGEELVKNTALNEKFDYVIVRPGQMYDDDDEKNAGLTGIQILEGMFSKTKPENKSVKLMLGDSLVGDISRSMVAEAITQALSQSAAANKAFSIVGSAGATPDQGKWDQLFQSLHKKL